MLKLNFEFCPWNEKLLNAIRARYELPSHFGGHWYDDMTKGTLVLRYIIWARNMIHLMASRALEGRTLQAVVNQHRDIALRACVLCCWGWNRHGSRTVSTWDSHARPGFVYLQVLATGRAFEVDVHKPLKICSDYGAIQFP